MGQRSDQYSQVAIEPAERIGYGSTRLRNRRALTEKESRGGVRPSHQALRVEYVCLATVAPRCADLSELRGLRRGGVLPVRDLNDQPKPRVQLQR